MKGGLVAQSPSDIAGPGAEIHVFNIATASDTVHVVEFADGGIISYQKDTGLFVHTLNNSTGFQRKLENLGICL
ncbi:MAG: hypothetical protein HN368_13395 [Spirochaetales bacterium]|jgi:hypothetical protein|nr:hypothetical protein [Spirochaetales bacterium]